MRPQIETHRTGKAGWLRAAVMGADDGILSTASLMLGVAAANGTHAGLLIAGVAGLVAGAMSMAAGEYVSVHSQADTEQADLALEKKELSSDDQGDAGIGPDLCRPRLGAGSGQTSRRSTDDSRRPRRPRARRVGIDQDAESAPVQAAAASALSFERALSCPCWSPRRFPADLCHRLRSATSLVCLAVLGEFAAHAGGANAWKGSLRTAFWGSAAMAVTAGVGVSSVSRMIGGVRQTMKRRQKSIFASRG